MMTRRTITLREEEGVANERIPPRGEQVTIVGQKEVNEAVSPTLTQAPKAPQAPFYEGDMKNADLRAALKDLTQFRTT